MLFSDRENANTADGERLMVDLELEDGLAIITIDRPHARNAISLETMDQLEKALDGAEGASALVITGAGVAAGAPYDAIISAAAADRIAGPWLAQLAIGGRLIGPVRDRDGEGQALHRIERVSEDQWDLTVLDPVRFVPLRTGTVR